MPQFRQFKVAIYELRTFADSEEQGEQIIREWQESEGELDAGVKGVKHQLGWTEFDGTEKPSDLVAKRDTVLASFLDLMQNKLGGSELLPRPAEKPVEGRIITIGATVTGGG